MLGSFLKGFFESELHKTYNSKREEEKLIFLFFYNQNWTQGKYKIWY